jgi:hypothetical protein
MRFLDEGVVRLWEHSRNRAGLSSFCVAVPADLDSRALRPSKQKGRFWSLRNLDR